MSYCSWSPWWRLLLPLTECLTNSQEHSDLSLGTEVSQLFPGIPAPHPSLRRFPVLDRRLCPQGQTGANRLSVRQELIKRTREGRRDLFSVLVWWEQPSQEMGVRQSPVARVGTVRGFGISEPDGPRCAHTNPTDTGEGHPCPASQPAHEQLPAHTALFCIPTDCSWSPEEGGAFTCTSRGSNPPRFHFNSNDGTSCVIYPGTNRSDRTEAACPR